MHRRFADSDPSHVAELRSTLEASAARLAAERRTDRDVVQLEALLVRREQCWAEGNGGQFVAADVRLHMAVVAASPNDVLVALYADLGNLVADWVRTEVGTGPHPAVYLDHARLIDAIRRGDASTAAVEAAGHSFACLGAHRVVPQR